MSKRTINFKKKSSMAIEDEETFSPQQDLKKPDQELEPVLLDHSKLNYCKFEDCQQKHIGPHSHQLDQCKRHGFCEMESAVIETDLDNTIPLGYIDKDAGFKIAKERREWVKMVVENRELHNLTAQGKKMRVTEYSLDHWFAQTFGLDITNMPAYRPNHIEKKIFDALKKKYKSRVDEKDNTDAISEGSGADEELEDQ